MNAYREHLLDELGMQFALAAVEDLLGGEAKAGRPGGAVEVNRAPSPLEPEKGTNA